MHTSIPHNVPSQDKLAIPWFISSDEAFHTARETDRPIFIYIASASCQVCQKMERESFSHEQIVALLQAHFICLYVDRDKRPDIDRYYQGVYTLLNRIQGSWPLCLFCTSTSYPFYASTYIPPVTRNKALGFEALLLAMYEKTSRRDKKLFESALEIETFVQKEQRHTEATPLTLAIRTRFITQAMQAFEPTYGGFSDAPKFPNATTLATLLLLTKQQRDTNIEQIIRHSLDQMIQGGFYDIIESGFNRYSTDAQWHLPNFEKKSSDNALLITLYADAANYFNNPTYLQVAHDCATFMLDKMSESSLFFNTMETDALNTEKTSYYYSFSNEELNRVNPEIKHALACSNHTKDAQQTLIRFAHAYNHEHLLALRQTLLPTRQQRQRPPIDKTILVHNSALMICALCSLAEEFEHYTKIACQSLDALYQYLYADKRLLHTPTEKNQHVIDGFFDDYIYLAHATLTMYQLTKEPILLHDAQHLMQQAINRYYDRGKLYFTQGKLRSEAQMHDLLYPSAIALFVENLLLLDEYSAQNYRSIAFSVLEYYSKELMHAPMRYPTLSAATLHYLAGKSS